MIDPSEINLMDVATILSFFDRFHANHKTSCGVIDLDVSAERDENGTTLALKCPTCQSTVKGSVRDADMWQLSQLMNPKKAN